MTGQTLDAYCRQCAQPFTDWPESRDCPKCGSELHEFCADCDNTGTVTESHCPHHSGNCPCQTDYERPCASCGDDGMTSCESGKCGRCGGCEYHGDELLMRRKEDGT